MATLHYGTDQAFDLDNENAEAVIGSVAARLADEPGSGWITFVDTGGTDWTILITTGVPIWLNMAVSSSDPSSVSRIH